MKGRVQSCLGSFRTKTGAVLLAAALCQAESNGLVMIPSWTTLGVTL